MTRRSTALLILSVAGMLGVACFDTTSPPANDSAHLATPRVVFSASELMELNPMRRVGELHNAVLRVHQSAFYRTRSRSRACEALLSWVSSDSALDDLSASDRERLLAGFRDSSLCRSRRDRRTSLASTEVEYPYQVSSAGMAVIDSILT
jgi:hypothetical protein